MISQAKVRRCKSMIGLAIFVYMLHLGAYGRIAVDIPNDATISTIDSNVIY
jgi:hypothetical protein